MYQKLVLCALKTLGSSVEQYWYRVKILVLSQYTSIHSYDILGARMLWKPKEARILKNFKEF